MSVEDSFGLHETGGQPYDHDSLEESKEANRIAHGFIRCFLESSIKDDEFAWAVGHRSLAEASSLLLREDLGPRWRGVLCVLAAEAAAARWRTTGSHQDAMARIEKGITDKS